MLGPFDDPVFLILVVALVGTILFLYLLARRTLLGLREGYESAARDGER